MEGKQVHGLPGLCLAASELLSVSGAESLYFILKSVRDYLCGHYRGSEMDSAEGDRRGEGGAFLRRCFSRMFAESCVAESGSRLREGGTEKRGIGK